MTDDIATSLRSSAEWIKDLEHESWFGTAELQIEAADEIERLRAEVAELQEGQLTNRWPLHKMLAAERELADRLAVALAAQGSASFDEDTNLNIKRLALDAFKEARRG